VPSNAPSDGKRAQREYRHLACEIHIDGERHTAVLLNLSTSGLFVRSNATPAPDTPVFVVVRRPGGAKWEITTTVARSVGRSEAGGSTRGIGLQIIEAPAAYFDFLESLAD